MRKIIPYILITVIALANIFAPFSVGNNNQGNLSLNKKVIEAEDDVGLTTKTSANDTSITVEVTAFWYGDETEDPWYYKKPEIANFKKVVVVLEKDGKEQKTEKVDLYEVSVKDQEDIFTKSGSVTFSGLKPATTYRVTAFAAESELDLDNIISLVASGGISYLLGVRMNEETGKTVSEPIDITTNPEGVTTFSSGGENTTRNYNPNDFMPVCGITSGQKIMGCLAQGIYYLFFIPSSFLFAATGTFFDWTFNYSVKSSSYKSDFVVQGWNIVRDFCNMFFIFILLYIAFKTILNLGTSKTKEMIINVIIIGLLINFSLFVTRVIVDTSNVLARVFYNSNTIKITAVKNDGDLSNMVRRADKEGVIPLSAALVNKVNPQALILNAREVGNIKDKANQTLEEKEKNGITTGTFIIVTLLASAINVVGLIVFLSVGLIFVVRTVGLWLAMILAPIAFFSYTVPEMRGIEMIGWGKWWPQTLKLAFLAPVFIFFLYLILQFLEIGLGTLDAEGKGTLGFLISIVLPFAFIMVLLIQAKKLAIKMSGEMGEGVSRLGSMAGGLAVGAMTGGAALAMRGTLGRYALGVANSDKLREDATKGGFTGWQAKMRLKTAGAVSKSSFDARNTVLGKKAGEGLGVNFGKAKEGGFVKTRTDQIAKEQKRAKELSELGENSNEVKILRSKEVQLKKIENEKSHELHLIEGKLEAARQDAVDANNAKNAANSNDSNYNELVKRAQEANERVNKLKTTKSSIASGGVSYKIDPNTGYLTNITENNEDGSIKYHTDNGKITKTEYDRIKEEADKAKNEVNNIEEKISNTNKELEEFEKKVAKMGSQVDLIENGKQRKEIQDKINKIQEEKQLLKNRREDAEKNLARAETGVKDSKGNYIFGKSINELKYTDIPNAKNEVEKIKNMRKLQYAESIKTKQSKVFNFIISGGQYSYGAADEAANKIIMDTEIKGSGDKSGNIVSSAPKKESGPKEEKKENSNERATSNH